MANQDKFIDGIQTPLFVPEQKTTVELTALSDDFDASHVGTKAYDSTLGYWVQWNGTAWVEDDSGGAPITQNNFSRTINVSAQDIAPFFSEGDVEDRLIAYVNDLDYEKLETDSDVWIKFDDAVTEVNSSVILVGSPCDFDPTLQTLTQNYYHTGSSALPVAGDYVYEDETMTTPLPIGWYSDGTKWYNSSNSIGLVNTTLDCF